MLILLFCAFQKSHAQTVDSTATTIAKDSVAKATKIKLKIEGSLGISQDFFYYNSNDLLYTPYRPTSLTRFVGSATISYKKFSLPFSMMISTQGGNTLNTPIPKKLSFKDLMNNYNQLSFSPTYKSFQALIGNQVPKYSELTTGDLPVFGGGFAWSPKKFRIAAFYGTSQRAINSDTLQKIIGAYKRISMCSKIGFGKEEDSHFYLIGTKHTDLVKGVTVLEHNVLPKENIVGSVDWKLKLFKKFYVQSETAVSAYSSDLKSGIIDADTVKEILPRQVFTPRISSSFGYAGVGKMGYDGKTWGFRTVGRFYSAGYQTLNYPFLQNDRLDLTFEPRFILFKNKFMFNGSIGKRSDNFSQTKTTTTHQVIGSANVNIQILPTWSLSGVYSNFGIRNTFQNDTFRLQNVSHSLNMSSNYSFAKGATIHAINVSFSQDIFQDFNVITAALMNNQSQNYLGTYTLAFAENPLSITLLGSYFENKISIGTLKVEMASIMANYELGKKKQCNLSLQSNFIRTDLADFSPDDNITTTLNIAYKISKKINFGLNGTLNLYRYGTAKPGIRQQENAARTFLTYKF